MKPMKCIRLWTNIIRVYVRKADVIHRAASRHDRVLCGTSGSRSVSIGYFKSRCSASGCKVEQVEQVKSVKKEQCRSAHGAKD
jgi:hypothetical protein